MQGAFKQPQKRDIGVSVFILKLSSGVWDRRVLTGSADSWRAGWVRQSHRFKDIGYFVNNVGPVTRLLYLTYSYHWHLSI